MKKKKTLAQRIATRISRKKCDIIMREDFRDLGGYDQVGRVLRALEKEKVIIRIGYGLYAKTKRSRFTDEIIPVKPIEKLAVEAVEKLGLKVALSDDVLAYNENRSTQVPTGRTIPVKGFISRSIGYKNVSINFIPVDS